MEAGASDDTRDKFKRVLNGLLKQDYNVTNDVYFEMFITHLSGKGGEGMYLSLLSCRLFQLHKYMYRNGRHERF